MSIPPLSSLQTPVFLVNSRLGLFTASVLRRNPFSRSYGAILPSSLARVLSFALVSSTHLPVSVCGTVTHIVPYEAFLVSVESPEFILTDFPIALSLYGIRVCLYTSLVLGPEPSPGSDYPSASPLRSNTTQAVLDY